MTIVLQVMQGDQVEPARDFDKDVVRVGRDPSNDVVLGEQGSGGVSRNHAELRYASGEWRVVDLKSSNGTYLRGQRITEAGLVDGDVIQFAPQGPRLRVSLPTALGDTAVGATPRPAAAPAAPPVATGVTAATVRQPRAEPSSPEHARPEPPRAEPPRIDPPRVDPPRPEASRPEPPRMDPPRPPAPRPDPPRPDPRPAVAASAPTDSELLPLRMGMDPVAARGYLVPGLVTVGTISALLWTYQSGEVKYSLMITMFFFVMASATVIYLLCGKKKSLGPMIAAAIMVGVLVSAGHSVVMAPIEAVMTPYISKQVPGKTPGTVRYEEPDTVPGLFIYMYFMAALPEELEKISPALLGLFIAMKVRRKGHSSPLEDQFAVREPLDGILMGIAGAAGFHFVEAVQYAQAPLAKFAMLQQNAPQLLAQLIQKYGANAPALLMQQGLDAGLSAAFQVILRGLRGAVGHLAYSGIFGYYVGLAALRPDHKWTLLLRGFLTATLVHATWNATSGVGGGIFVPPVAFALLITSIIKARSVSPSREANFATTLGRGA